MAEIAAVWEFAFFLNTMYNLLKNCTTKRSKYAEERNASSGSTKGHDCWRQKGASKDNNLW
jgi:hypothetical protein